MEPIVLDVSGPMACFCPPYAKVERYSYPVPTPSAIRGLLSAIYAKPSRFFWSVRKIEVLEDIKYFSVKTNEVKVRLVGSKSIDLDDATGVRTQRTTQFLKDVAYRITADMITREHSAQAIAAAYSQANRRISKGQCFFPPYLGMSECVCRFGPPDYTKQPIQKSQDFGFMVYDVFEPWLEDRDSPANVSYYHAVMVNGVIEVPRYDSPEIRRLEKGGVV